MQLQTFSVTRTESDPVGWAWLETKNERGYEHCKMMGMLSKWEIDPQGKHEICLRFKLTPSGTKPLGSQVGQRKSGVAMSVWGFLAEEIPQRWDSAVSGIDNTRTLEIYFKEWVGLSMPLSFFPAVGSKTKCWLAHVRFRTNGRIFRSGGVKECDLFWHRLYT